MERLKRVLAACYDHLFAPDCVFDKHSDGYCDLNEAPKARWTGAERRDEGFQEPLFNIDGVTPMVRGAGVDVHGNGYGITSSNSFSSWE